MIIAILFKEKIWEINVMSICQHDFIPTISKKWQNIIEEDSNANNYHVFADYIVLVNDKMVKLSEITTQDVYWVLLEKEIKRPISEGKWQIETGLNFDQHDWGEIYTSSYSLND